MDIKIPKKWFQPSKWNLFGDVISLPEVDVKKKGKRSKKNKIYDEKPLSNLFGELPSLTSMITGVVTLGIVIMVGSTILGTVKETLTDPAYNTTNEVTQSLLTSVSIFTPMIVIMIMLGTGIMLWIQRASIPIFFFAEFLVSLFLTILGASPGLAFTISVLMCAFYVWWYFRIDDGSDTVLESF